MFFNCVCVCVDRFLIFDFFLFVQVPEEQIPNLLSLIQLCLRKGAAFDATRHEYEAMLAAARNQPATAPEILDVHRKMASEISLMTQAASSSYELMHDLLKRVKGTLAVMAAAPPLPTGSYKVIRDCKFHAYTRLAATLMRRVGPLSMPSSGPAVTPITFARVPESSAAYVRVQNHILMSMPTAVLSSVHAVQAAHLDRQYAHYRDHVLRPSSEGGAVNQAFLFHGTRTDPRKLLLDHGDEGLDPRMSRGGFLGRGTYLAMDARYVVDGNYGYVMPDGNVVFIVVQASLGTPLRIGRRVDRVTRDLRRPPIRVGSSPPVRYGSVIGGPHRAGDSGHSSAITCVYKAAQMRCAYLVELKMRPAARACSKRQRLN